jgi:hypothetical protein
LSWGKITDLELGETLEVGEGLLTLSWGKITDLEVGGRSLTLS